MGRVGKEVAGQVLVFVGFVGVCLSCGIPMWRVTTYIGANIVTGQIVWDGLWMNCVMQSTGQMQCNIQNNIMSLSQDLQAARALMVISFLIAFLSFTFCFMGAKCTSCLKKESSQAKVVILAGVLSIIAGVICLIPVSWSAAVSITEYISPIVIQSQKRELGASIYIGWGSTVLLIVGGSVLCTSCPPKQRANKFQTYPSMYTAYPGSVYTGSYVPAKSYYYPPQYMPSKSYQPVSRASSHREYI